MRRPSRVARRGGAPKNGEFSLVGIPRHTEQCEQIEREKNRLPFVDR